MLDADRLEQCEAVGRSHAADGGGRRRRARERTTQSSDPRRSVTEPPVDFFIASHKNPQQVERLARRILRDADTSRVLLHHDAPETEQPDPTRMGCPMRVRFLPRRAAHWGGISLVDLFVEGVRDSLAAGASHVVFLSGQDYPLRSVQEIVHRVRNGPDLLLSGRLINGGNPEGEPISRYLYAWRHLSIRGRWLQRALWVLRGERPGRAAVHVRDHLRPVQRVAWREFAGRLAVGLRRRKVVLTDNNFCWASQWCILSAAAMSALADSWRPNGDWPDYFARSLIPDECAVQSLLLATPGISVSIGGNRRFTLFDEGEHPLTLTSEHLPQLLASDADFARKFDISVDAVVLDRLDDLASRGRR